MQKRQQILVIITVAIIALILGFNYLMPEDSAPLFDFGPGGDLGEVRDQFKDYLKTLKDGQQTIKDYKQIAFNLPERTGNQDPGATFENQLYKLLSEQLGMANPRVGTAKPSEIKNVSEYQFLDITVEATGAYGDMTKLLQDMERLGLLIKTFSLSQTNRFNANTTDTINLKVTVARLVKRDKSVRRPLRLSTSGR